MSKNVKVFNDEEGFVIIRIAGKEFVSSESIPMVNGKFKSSEVQKLVFGMMI